jgi:hypothetical protein
MSSARGGEIRGLFVLTESTYATTDSQQRITTMSKVSQLRRDLENLLSWSPGACVTPSPWPLTPLWAAAAVWSGRGLFLGGPYGSIFFSGLQQQTSTWTKTETWQQVRSTRQSRNDHELKTSSAIQNRSEEEKLSIWGENTASRRRRGVAEQYFLVDGANANATCCYCCCENNIFVNRKHASTLKSNRPETNKSTRETRAISLQRNDKCWQHAETNARLVTPGNTNFPSAKRK